MVEQVNVKVEALQSQVDAIASQQRLLTRFAWIAVAIGAGFFIYGCWYKGCHREWCLEDMGAYLGGSAGTFWGFAGLLFIYLGFLGQKQEIKNQQIELILTRDEMEASRKELSGQREQLKEQKDSLDRQTAALLSQVQTLQREMDFRTLKELTQDLTILLDTLIHGKSLSSSAHIFFKRINDFALGKNYSGEYEGYQAYMLAVDFGKSQEHFEDFFIGIERLTNKIISIHYLIKHSCLSQNEKVIILNDLTYQLGNFIPNDFRTALTALSQIGEDGLILDKQNHPKLKLVRYFYRTVLWLFVEWENVNSSIYVDIGDYSAK